MADLSTDNAYDARSVPSMSSKVCVLLGQAPAACVWQPVLRGV